MTDDLQRYRRHRFPPEIISHAVSAIAVRSVGHDCTLLAEPSVDSARPAISPYGTTGTLVPRLPLHRLRVL